MIRGHEILSKGRALPDLPNSGCPILPYPNMGHTMCPTSSVAYCLNELKLTRSVVLGSFKLNAAFYNLYIAKLTTSVGLS